MISKKGFLVRDYVIATIIFGAIIALFVVFAGGLSIQYNNPDLISDDFNTHYNHLSSSLSTVDTMLGTAKSSGGLNLLGAFDVAFTAVISAFQLVLDSISFYTGIIPNMIADFTFLDPGVLTILFDVGLAIIVVYLLFVWWSSVMRGRI